MQNKFLSGLLLLFLAVAINGCSDDSSSTTADLFTQDAAALSLNDFTFNSGDTAESVTANFSTITTTPNGYLVMWQSGNEAVTFIDGNATVTRPGYEAGDATITITATIVNGVESTTKDFTITVLCTPITDAEAVADAKEALGYSDISFSTGDDSSNVTSEFVLPATGLYSTTISWSSDDSAVTIAGGNATVTRPAFGDGDAIVTLTATITKGIESDIKELTVTVLETPAKLIIFHSGTSTQGNFTESSHQGWCDTQHTSLALNLSVVKPFISRTGSNIKDISGVPITVNVLSPNGTIIADDWADLWNETTALTNSLFTAGILPTGVTGYWWSGSNADGTVAVAFCSNWTTIANSGTFPEFLGRYGTPHATSSSWINTPNQTCANSRPVLCIGWEE